MHAASAIIEGKGATYYGIGALTARLVEAVVRDQRGIYTVTATIPEYGCSMALPRLLTGQGVGAVITPHMSPQEKQALEQSAEVLRSFARQLPA